ncbi:hypothetical protein MMC26_003661 [Xylographa opegraphella]|nr:hypothetical protein [Xylographa opegraphella]
MEGKDSFHAKTKSAKPDQPGKATTYWAGVLMCDKNTAGPKTEEDYLWVKCHHRVTADKILQQYKARNPTEDVVLRSNGRIVGNETMKMLDVHGDQVIAFEGIKRSDVHVPAAGTTSRKPLHPSGRQISQPRVLSPEPASLASDVKKEQKSLFPNAKVHGHLRSPSKPKVKSEDAYRYRTDTTNENIPPSSKISPSSQLATAATASPSMRPVPQTFHQASNEGGTGPFPTEMTGWAVNPPFMRYLQLCHISWKSRIVGLPEERIQSLAWESWRLLT